MTFGALDNPTTRRDHEFGADPLIRDPVRRVPASPSTTLAGTVGVAPAAAAFSCRGGLFFDYAYAGRFGGSHRHHSSAELKTRDPRASLPYAANFELKMLASRGQLPRRSFRHIPDRR